MWTDGERDTAIYNAEMIRNMGLHTPVVYAGNIENQDEMKLIFDEESGQELYLVDNVYPKIDTLNVATLPQGYSGGFRGQHHQGAGHGARQRHGKRSDHSDTGSGYGMYEAAV